MYESPAPDTSPPTAPGTPAASAVTSSSVSLSWAASTDNVGVTGYDVVRVQGSAESTAATSATTTASVTGLTPSTSYTFAVYARDAAGNRSPRSATVTVTTSGTGSGTGGCTVTPATQSQWSTGYVIQVTVTNTGTATVNGWGVAFTLPSGHALTGGWNATMTVNGQAVTARGVAHNGTLAPGASASFGFQATRPSGDTRLPSDYRCA
ncbi:cellulose binding domain-containing protein [Nonomuraea sp. B12E4]|uniref:cellulose binding domain-containing protein n=1 Tax=Nonomuraea sp. B12E4 TaxID=3153564 RepID=UPI00325DCF7D